MDCNGWDCHSECELRHLDRWEQSLQRQLHLGDVANQPSKNATGSDCQHTSHRPRLVLCAGPERSASTWLYNAVRHLHSAAGIPCDSYWIHRLRPEKIDERLAQDPSTHRCHTVCIKTHKYYDDYDDWLWERYHPIVLVTHRDLWDVLTSYRRVGWTWDLPSEYVHHHLKWQSKAALDLQYHEIINDERSALQKLATKLNLCIQNDQEKTLLDLVQQRIHDLSIPMGMVDPVTKLWPFHRNDPSTSLTSSSRNQSNDKKNDFLVNQHPEFYRLYPDLL